MIICYCEHLTPEQCDLLAKNGWHITTCHEDEHYKRSSESYDNKLYMGHYLGISAEKDFANPGEAMFEIERLFNVDVIEERDHDGCSLHTFRWENPNWNGKCLEDFKGDGPAGSEWFAMQHASGWTCACFMYGAPKTPREAAIEIQKLRAQLPT